MRARRWFEWHSWIGVTAGLLLFVICWSGTIAVFSDEIDWLLNPAERVHPRGEYKTWDEWRAGVESRYPAFKVDTLHPPPHAFAAAEILALTPEGRYQRIHVNPYTAGITGHTSYFNTRQFFRSLHRSLFDPGGTGFGHYLVTAFSLVLMASLMTALMFYKRWWQRFFRWRAHRNRRTFWSDTHKLAGLWSLWFVLLMAVTGLWYFVRLAGTDFNYPVVEPVGKQQGVRYQSFGTLLQRAEAVAPDLEISTFHAPGGFYGDVAVFYGQHTAWFARDRGNALVLNAVTGEPLLVRSAADVGWPARWVDTADALHFGNFGGLVSKTIWFLFGLVLSGLSLSGAYLHAKRQQAHHHGVPRSRAVTSAYLITVVILLLACGGAVSEVRDYGPPYSPPSVWLFMAAWLATTLLILTYWIKRIR